MLFYSIDNSRESQIGAIYNDRYILTLKLILHTFPSKGRLWNDVRYEDMYEFWNCLELSPCFGRAKKIFEIDFDAFVNSSLSSDIHANLSTEMFFCFICRMVEQK